LVMTMISLRLRKGSHFSPVIGHTKS
jgi:hypothetical protein